MGGSHAVCKNVRRLVTLGLCALHARLAFLYLPGLVAPQRGKEEHAKRRENATVGRKAHTRDHRCQTRSPVNLTWHPNIFNPFVKALGCHHFTPTGGRGDLANETVVIGVVTNSKLHRHVKRLHYPLLREMQLSTPLATAVLYFSTGPLGGIPSYYHDEGNPRKVSAANRFLQAIHFVAAGCLGLPHLKWFFLMDDDTMVGVRRLARLLGALDRLHGSDRPLLVARATGGDPKTASVFGGNGVLFSRGMLGFLGRPHGHDALRKAMNCMVGGSWYYESRLFNVLREVPQCPAAVMRLGSPFGLGLPFMHGGQDEVANLTDHGSGDPSKLWGHPKSATAVTLHKVVSEGDHRAAARVLSPDVPEHAYDELLDSARPTYP